MEPQIRLWGGCVIRDAAGVALRLPTRKCCALLAYLALSGGHDVAREELAALLWPRGSDGSARASLRQELAVLRRVLAAAGLPQIDSGREYVSLNLSADTVDIRAMEHLIKVGSSDALQRAVALYGGEFMAGLNVVAQPFEDWLLVERQRLKALVQNAYLQLLDIEAAGPDPEAAITTATALLAIEPTQEQGHRALMRLYQRTGRRAEALQQFQRCAEILRRDLDADPSRESVALAERIRTDLGGPRGNGRLVKTASPLVAALLAVPEQAETQRMIVLVASLAGVATLSPAIAPQDLAQLQDRLRLRCGRAVSAHGGSVAPGQGHRVVACFGYPEHKSGDLDRAIRAALAIAAEPIALSVALAVWPRVGMASGSVLIRADPLSPEAADLVGVPVQRACDFAQVAEGGEVVICSGMRTSSPVAMLTSVLPKIRYGGDDPIDPGHLIQNFGRA